MTCKFKQIWRQCIRLWLQARNSPNPKRMMGGVKLLSTSIADWLTSVEAVSLFFFVSSMNLKEIVTFYNNYQ